MSVNRDKKRGTWMSQVRYRDMFGTWHKTTKRGFKTKAEAKAWEDSFRARADGMLDMTFSQFFKVYAEDVRPRLKTSTWETKAHMVRTKVLPFFGDTKMCDIRPADVVRWENWLLGLDLSSTYVRTIVNQLSAILNHAVRFYRLPANPVLAAGKVGSKKPEREMAYWTPGEYHLFSEAVTDKPDVYYAFELLYYTGIRVGELLALTPANIDLDRSLILVRGTYQRIAGKDTITSPKTKNSVRDVLMPDFLRDELEDYLSTRTDLKKDERVFAFTAHRLRHEMRRGAEAAGVKAIRVHDLRHSHAALLIDLGFSAQAIADRLGHSTTEVTETYSHLFPSTQQNLAAALNEVGVSHDR